MISIRQLVPRRSGRIVGELSLLAVASALILSQGIVRAADCPPDYILVSGVCFPNNTGLSSTPAETIILNVMNWLLAVLGFIAIVGFVISGIQYLLAAGDDDVISTAKRNMKYSIIGVIVALSGYVLIMAINNLLVANSPTF